MAALMQKSQQEVAVAVVACSIKMEACEKQSTRGGSSGGMAVAQNAASCASKLVCSMHLGKNINCLVKR